MTQETKKRTRRGAATPDPSLVPAFMAVPSLPCCDPMPPVRGALTLTFSKESMPRIAQAKPRMYRSLTGSRCMTRRSVSPQTSANRFPSMAQLEKDSMSVDCRMNPSSATYRSASIAAGCGSPSFSVPGYSEDGEQGADGQSAFSGVSVFSCIIKSFPSVGFECRRMPSLVRSAHIAPARIFRAARRRSAISLRAS